MLGEVFTLSFDYAPRTGCPLNSSTGVIYWNNNQTAILSSTNYNITRFSTTVQVYQGLNNITFQGTGDAKGGMLIDNVVLLRRGDSHNYMLNGDF
jgi:hypothetical protein